MLDFRKRIEFRIFDKHFLNLIFIYAGAGARSSKWLRLAPATQHCLTVCKHFFCEPIILNFLLSLCIFKKTLMFILKIITVVYMLTM